MLREPAKNHRNLTYSLVTDCYHSLIRDEPAGSKNWTEFMKKRFASGKLGGTCGHLWPHICEQ